MLRFNAKVMSAVGMLLILLAAVPAVGSDVEVWLTRGDQASLLEQRPSLTFQPGTGTHGTQIQITPTLAYQTIEGFGAALTDSSAWLIQNELSTAQRDALMEQLFSAQLGIGIGMLHLPMGASDFALTAYTYDDMPAGQTDPLLSNFSIAHDLAYIIPTLQQAGGLNPELKLLATPWSPPAWMKSSETLLGGSLEWQYHEEYAQYFVKFVEDYAAESLTIDYVTVQNEPLHDSVALPSASMATFQQSTFIGDHLGPAFAAAAIDTRILCYDHNWDEWNYPVVVLNDPEANVYIAGSAFHGYAGDVANQSLVQGYFPDKEIHFTEISGGDWAPNFSDNLVWNFRHIIIGATRNWARSVMFWNLALDEDNGPYLPGGCDNCRGVVTIERGRGNVTREVEYYVLGHAGKFVQPGARRIHSDTIEDEIETVAFRNPDGSEVLIALNPTGSSRWFDVLRNGEYVSYRLIRQSVATLVWPALTPGDFDNSSVVEFDDVDDEVSGNANSLFDYLDLPPPAPEHDLVDTGASAGVIDQADLVALVEEVIGSVVGDLDRDFAVSLDDHQIMVSSFGQPAGYFQGDLNGDGNVDLRDFGIFQVNYARQGTSAP
ncbi:MAG: glycosyl hydrolase [bacterium]|nr:glycosyl hydrolase [bacterium]